MSRVRHPWGRSAARRFCRAWAMPILSLWLLAFVINVLGPCCDGLEAGTSHDDEIVHAPLHVDAGAPAGDHDHCPSLDKVDSGLLDSQAWSAGGERLAVAPASPVPMLALHVRLVGPMGRQPVLIFPDTGPPLYLSTRRFRI